MFPKFHRIISIQLVWGIRNLLRRNDIIRRAGRENKQRIWISRLNGFRGERGRQEIRTKSPRVHRQLTENRQSSATQSFTTDPFDRPCSRAAAPVASRYCDILPITGSYFPLSTTTNRRRKLPRINLAICVSLTLIQKLLTLCFHRRPLNFCIFFFQLLFDRCLKISKF